MPLFRRIEPELRPLIAYIVARAKEQSVTLNRTKLVKLLYLIDVERVRSRRDPLTGLDWVFFHYGPYAMELIDTLESSEAAVVAKAKRDRPVIVLGGTSAKELRPARASHAGTVMVIPVYGADQFDEHTRRRISYYDYTNAFYLPANDRPKFDEGFARLDHTQPVSTDHLIRHRGLKLSSDALDALVEWFVAFTTNRQLDDSLILEYRREMLSGS